MAQTLSFLNETPEDWRLFGEVKLLTSAAINDRMHTWLEETLRPLGLNDHFLSKLLASADLVVAQNTSSGSSPAQKQIHLLIYTPGGGLPHGQSWGFFWMEKKRDAKSDATNPNHAIEFYLYWEGR